VDHVSVVLPVAAVRRLRLCASAVAAFAAAAAGAGSARLARGPRAGQFIVFVGAGFCAERFHHASLAAPGSAGGPEGEDG
jgi:hypothetical protein